MSYGALFRNENQTYVIDGKYVNPRLIRKGSGPAVAEGSTGNADRTRRLRVPLNVGEVIAFACSDAPAIFAGYDGTSAILCAGTDTTPVYNIEYWIFSQNEQDTGQNGVIIRNPDNGNKIFDSAWRILRVTDTIGSGSKTLSPGRKYAAIPQQVNMIVRREQSNFSYPNPPLPNVVSRSNEGDGIKIVDNVVSVQKAVSSFWTTAVFYGVAGWTLVPAYNNGLTTNYLIVDVTGY